jgi:hypothetical protein
MSSREESRQEKRAQALVEHSAAYETARTELAKIYDEGPRNRLHYAIRRDLVHARHSDSAGSAPSSPAAALAPLKGWALHLYLIAIFDAQSRRPAGVTVANTRPLCSVNGTGSGWADLLPAIVVKRDGAPITKKGLRAGMRRQAVHALNLLEREHLAAIRGAPSGAPGRYNQVQFLDETGDGRRSVWSRHYSIPRISPFEPSNAIVLLPKSFFLNGWVHVLTAAEITTYLMILDLQIRHPEAASTGVFKVASQRVDRYGIRRDVYATHRQLAGYGLIRRLDDPNRSPDGRILRRSSQRYVSQPYRFTVLPDGFDRPALTTVAAHLLSQPG